MTSVWDVFHIIKSGRTWECFFYFLLTFQLHNLGRWNQIFLIHLAVPASASSTVHKMITVRAPTESPQSKELTVTALFMMITAHGVYAGSAAINSFL